MPRGGNYFTDNHFTDITFHRQLFTDKFILPTVYFTEAHFTDKVILVIVVRVRVELGRIRAKVRVLFEKKLVGEMNFGSLSARHECERCQDQD